MSWYGLSPIRAFNEDGSPVVSDQWRDDCLHWRGRLLVGRHCHWCDDWDFLPIDETCMEWPCVHASWWQRMAHRLKLASWGI